MAQLRRLTEKGIERFQMFVDSMSTDEPEAFDPDIVNAPEHSKPISHDTVPDTCQFETRFDAAEFLSSVVQSASLPEPDFDRGFWSWIAWVWFESLCVPGKDGRRKPGELARWVLNLSWDRYYRHLLAGPWWIFEAHREYPDRARCLLCTPVTKPGDLVGQIAARQEMVSNPAVVEAATRLYYNSDTRKHKRGHASYVKYQGKSIGKPGTVRRLVDLCDQLDMIWDLYSTNTDEFVSLLPDEFSTFL